MNIREGRLKLTDRKNRIADFIVPNCSITPDRYCVKLDISDETFKKWFHFGDSVAAFVSDSKPYKPYNNLGFREELSIDLGNGQWLTAPNMYEFLRYKGETPKIDIQLGFKFC